MFEFCILAGYNKNQQNKSVDISACVSKVCHRKDTWITYINCSVFCVVYFTCLVHSDAPAEEEKKEEEEEEEADVGAGDMFGGSDY